jgi:hypothetical protein
MLCVKQTRTKGNFFEKYFAPTINRQTECFYEGKLPCGNASKRKSGQMIFEILGNFPRFFKT